MEPNLSAALERVTAARHRLKRYATHLDVALNYRPLLKASVRVGETENGIELAAMAVLDACDRARGSDPLAVAAHAG